MAGPSRRVQECIRSPEAAITGPVDIVDVEDESGEGDEGHGDHQVQRYPATAAPYWHGKRLAEEITKDLQETRTA